MTDYTETIRERLIKAFGAPNESLGELLTVACLSPAEGKFAVTIVSKAFEGKPPLACHRMVNKAIGFVAGSDDPGHQETCKVIHALQIGARAPGGDE